MKRRPPVGVWWSALPLVCVAALCGAWRGARTIVENAAGSPLRIFGPAPTFTLVDQAGEPFGSDQLLGRVWVVDFIFTRCAGQCPMMSARLAALQHDLADVPALWLVSITVDPAHDDPATLSVYAARYGARRPRWQFLTGDAGQIERLAREGFRLAFSPEGTPREPITHSSRLVLVDARGRVRGYYDAGEPGVVERLARDVRRLLREP